mgnify:FL=1
MSEDSMLMCLIAFVLGYLVARMMRGNGFQVDSQQKCVNYLNPGDLCHAGGDCCLPNNKLCTTRICPELPPTPPGPPSPPGPSCPAGLAPPRAPGERYCSDLVGICVGPSGMNVNGKFKRGVQSRATCQAGCDANSSCVGYTYHARDSNNKYSDGYCAVYGPGLDTDLAEGWTSNGHSETVFIERANGSSNYVCAAVAGRNPPPPEN